VIGNVADLKKHGVDDITKVPEVKKPETIYTTDN
jgi:hypothetical protein